jgi:hypothetical protein
LHETEQLSLTRVFKLSLLTTLAIALKNLAPQDFLQPSFDAVIPLFRGWLVKKLQKLLQFNDWRDFRLKGFLLSVVGPEFVASP